MKKLRLISLLLFLVATSFSFLMLSVAFSSCSDDTPEDVTFVFGMTSASSTSSKEITAINLAYTDAYRRAGLKFSSQSFGPAATKDIILEACVEAEGAIASSSIKFEASYTYEVFEVTTNKERIVTKKESIYRKVYGVRQ